MTPLFNKLNLGDHREILVLNAPESFEVELNALEGVTVHRDTKGISKIPFGMAFVQSEAQVKATAKLLSKAVGDAVFWFCYPKGTSKKYTCDFNRDTGWSDVRAAGFESVRMVAIDADWSALRFRRVEFIKTLKRETTPSRTVKK